MEYADELVQVVAKECEFACELGVLRDQTWKRARSTAADPTPPAKWHIPLCLGFCLPLDYVLGSAGHDDFLGARLRGM